MLIWFKSDLEKTVKDSVKDAIRDKENQFKRVNDLNKDIARLKEEKEEITFEKNMEEKEIDYENVESYDKRSKTWAAVI